MAALLSDICPFNTWHIVQIFHITCLVFFFVLSLVCWPIVFTCPVFISWLASLFIPCCVITFLLCISTVKSKLSSQALLDLPLFLIWYFLFRHSLTMLIVMNCDDQMISYACLMLSACVLNATPHTPVVILQLGQIK